MKSNTLKTITNNFITVVKKHNPEILTGIGIAGMITTTVMAVKATPKAIRLLEAEKDRQNRIILNEAKNNGYDDCKVVTRLHPIEIVKTTWTCYIPSTIMGVFSITCLVGASSVNARRNAALATAYSISKSALKEYQDKVVETIGIKKEQVVQDAIAKDKIVKDPVINNEVIMTDKGETLCYDVVSGRYFKSDIDRIRKAENELNRRMIEEMYISLNDFYYEIGLNNISIGDDIGWNIDDGLLELRFSSQLTDDGTPCLVINYYIAPRYEFGK